MIRVRDVLVVIALAFTGYLVVRGLWWTEPVAFPLLLVVAPAFYLMTTWMCILWRRPAEAPESREGRATTVGRLPVLHQVLALVCAVVVPSAVEFAAGAEARSEVFTTWYLGGIGALMTVVMAQRRPVTAWVGIAFLTVASCAWLGPLAALEVGLVGAVVWVAIAQVLVASLDRAAVDTEQLARLQRAATGLQASRIARERERRVRVRQALAVAGPVLTRTIASGGMLAAVDREEARLAEGSLRDEMRGARLLDDGVRAEVLRARRRGASVSVADDGGLEGLDAAEIGAVHDQIAAALRSAGSDRIIVRTSPHAGVVVTVVGRSSSTDGSPDDDDVDLWCEIPDPRER